MDNTEQILKIYEIYNESKEKFISRSFSTNKFYLVVEAILLMVTMIVGVGTPYDLLNIMLPTIGMIIAVMWWLNQDSYGFLIKIKYQKVLEVMEKSLAASPISDEFKAITEAAKTRKGFVFSDAHKFLAIVVLLIFFVLFLSAFIPYVMIMFSTTA